LPCAHAVAVRHPSLPCGNPLPCGVVRCRAHPFAVRRPTNPHGKACLCRALQLNPAGAQDHKMRLLCRVYAHGLCSVCARFFAIFFFSLFPSYIPIYIAFQQIYTTI
jgi:hypothetical protein